MRDKTLAVLIGLIAGMLVCCCGSGWFLASGSVSPLAEPSQAPAGAAIEAAIAESYVNRTFVQSAADYPSPWPVYGGLVDVLPGNRVRFTVQVESPGGLVTVNGMITLAARDGNLVIRVADVRLGQLPVTALARPFLADLEAQVNQQANRQLRERMAQAGMTLAGVSSDDTQLRFFLAVKP